MKINGVEKVEKLDSTWIQKENLYEVFLNITVEKTDELYSPKGIFLRVEYLVDEQEISRYHFFEKETNKYIKLAFKNSEEERMVSDYLKNHFAA